MSQFFAPERRETPEFTIRCYQPGDGALLQAACNASYEHLRTFMPWAKPDFTVEEQENRVRSYYGKHLTNTDFVMGVFSPDGTRLMGQTGFLMRGRSVEDATAEIGMWIAGMEANKGLGTRVLKQMLHWGFTEWSWMRIEWRCDTLNLASAAVARKGRMTLEGTLRQQQALPDGTRRDAYVFSMLREEYLRSNAQ